MDYTIGIVSNNLQDTVDNQTRHIHMICGKDTKIQVLPEMELHDFFIFLNRLFYSYPTIIVTSLTCLSNRWEKLSAILYMIFEAGFTLKVIHELQLVDVELVETKTPAGVVLDIHVLGVDWMKEIIMPDENKGWNDGRNPA
jgi:hypothetical protein